MEREKEAAKNRPSKDGKENKPNTYLVLRNCILKFYWFDVLKGAGFCLVGESFALGYNYTIKDLIKYIKFGTTDTDEGLMEGIKLIG